MSALSSIARLQGLVADESHTAIRGVRARIDNGAEQTILADLVVDASGPCSRTHF
jgi:hypothetical protein